VWPPRHFGVAITRDQNRTATFRRTVLRGHAVYLRDHFPSTQEALVLLSLIQHWATSALLHKNVFYPVAHLKLRALQVLRNEFGSTTVSYMT